MVIAIDGPAGAGKSSVARALARRLGYSYLDSGAMYRCVALAALERRLLDGSGESGGGGEPSRLGALARALQIRLGERVMLDGEDVTDAIRTPAVSELASRVSADPAVRAALVERQRQMLADGDWVAEGRDIGTVVAPRAEVKIFLTADPRVRARRRTTELGHDDPGVVAELQRLRDERDSTRDHSPLEAASDAVVLDTTELDVEAVVERIAGLVSEL
jgi:cytidylate kinase